MHRVSKKAFSLIELSIVILIIGIIIAGITKSSRLVEEMNLNSARAMTQSSPVSSIPDLAVWLETSYERSFLDAEREDEANLTTWYDINPQLSTKKNLSRGTSDARISFERDGISGLPSVYFDGNTTSTASLSAPAIIPSTNKFSFFLVLKSEDADSAEVRMVLVDGDTGGRGFAYFKNGSSDAGKIGVLYGGIAIHQTSTAASTLNAEIVRVTCDGSSVELYVNGSAQTLTSSNCSYGTILASDSFYVGNSGSAGGEMFKGLISEVIFFDRYLKAQEISDVENYLSKKYKIDI